MTIGERIRTRRKELNLTMKDIHAQVGIQTGNLSELENDKYLPSVQSLISLSKALKCSIDWILTGEESAYSLGSENPRVDGQLLSENETDLVSMYRYIREEDRKTIFDITSLKYEQATGEKASVYSTYFDTSEKQEKRRASGDDSSASGIA